MCHSRSVQRHKNMLEKKEQDWGAVRSCCAWSLLLCGHQSFPSACVPGTTPEHIPLRAALCSSGGRNDPVREWPSERLKVWKLRGSYSSCLFPWVSCYTETTLPIINVIHANDVCQNLPLSIMALSQVLQICRRAEFFRSLSFMVAGFSSNIHLQIKNPQTLSWQWLQFGHH